MAISRHLRLVTADSAHLELLAEWETWMRAQGLSGRTITERVRIVRQVATQCGVPAAEFSSAGLQAWLAELPGAGTRHTYYSAIRAWSLWLVRLDHRPDDPTIKVPSPRVPRGVPRPVSTAHLEALLALDLDPLTRTKILLIAYAGLRVHEVAKASGRDFDLISATITVTGKGGYVSVLPLHPLLATEAATLPRHGYWFPSPVRLGKPVLAASVSAVIAAAFDRIGVNATAHQIRHWFASSLLAAGTDIRVVQELMRHSSLATTARYTLVPDQHRREAIGGLPVIRLPDEHGAWSRRRPGP